MVVVTNRYIHDPDIVSTALENLIRLAKANDEYRSESLYINLTSPSCMRLCKSRNYQKVDWCDQRVR